MTLQVSIVSPEQVLFTGEADMVVARTTSGDAAFLTGHSPVLASLAAGKVRVVAANADIATAVVDGGFIEVSNDTVTVLTDRAELEVAHTS